MLDEPNKYLVVFDLDGIICLPSYTTEVINFFKLFNQKEKDVVKNFITCNPECPDPVIIQYSLTHLTHYIPPYLDVLFNYLINNHCRIAFFSAGYEERNIHLMQALLSKLLGNEQYLKLIEMQQFDIYSNQHIKDGLKDISIILKPDENIKNSVLIEDQIIYSPENIACLAGISLYKWNICYNEHKQKLKYTDFPKNLVYYLLGIFINYFENEKYLSLQDWLIANQLDKQILFKVSDIYKNILLGLAEVKKYYPEAICYSENTLISESDQGINITSKLPIYSSTDKPQPQMKAPQPLL